jgi:hypothetical protein
MDLAFAPEVRDPRVRAAAGASGGGALARRLAIDPPWKRIAASGLSSDVDSLVSRRLPMIRSQIDEGPLARRRVRRGLNNRDRRPCRWSPARPAAGSDGPGDCGRKEAANRLGRIPGRQGLGGMSSKATRSGATNA